MKWAYSFWRALKHCPVLHSSLGLEAQRVKLFKVTSSYEEMDLYLWTDIGTPPTCSLDISTIYFLSRLLSIYLEFALCYFPISCADRWFCSCQNSYFQTFASHTLSIFLNKNVYWKASCFVPPRVLISCIYEDGRTYWCIFDLMPSSPQFKSI